MLESGRVAELSDQGKRLYRCQATEFLKATTAVRRRDRWDSRFYMKDLTSGNVTIRAFVWYGVRAAINAFLMRWRG